MTTLLLRGVMQRRLRVALTGIAIALGVALMAGTYILTDTINGAFAEVFATSYKNKAVVVTERETLGRGAGSKVSTLDQATVARVRAVPGVAAASGTVSTGATLLTTAGRRLNSGAALSLVAGVQPARLESFTAAKGHLPRAAEEVAIDQATAQRDHLVLGERIVIAGRSPARRYTIAGIAKFAGSESFGGTSVALLVPQQAQYVAGEPVTALALTVGLGLVAFISVLAASTKATIDHAVSRSFAGSLIVMNTSSGQGIPATVAPLIREVEGVGAVTAIAFTKGRVRDLSKRGAPVIEEKGAVSAIEPASFASMHKIEWERGSDATLASLGQDGTVIAKKLASAHDLRVGQREDAVDFISYAPGADGARVQDGIDALLRRSFPQVHSQTAAQYTEEQSNNVNQLLLLVYVLLALSGSGYLLSIPVGTLILLLLAAAIAGLLAAELPARRAAKLDVLSALASE